MTSHVFDGVMPALMTPCRSDGTPDLDALVASGRRLTDAGMGAVVYCGSMGDWPLLTDEQRQAGVAALVEEGLRVIVGTGGISPASAVGHARHAASVGAAGLMLIPRVLSRGSALAAQREHFRALLEAGRGLPSVIYNSPYYGFTTDAALFFDLRSACPNLVGFKEFAGGDALTYAAEHITSGDDELALLVGVDTQVVHGVVNCGATGAITGIGNVLPGPVL
jgi:4-hydroxy-tetrahydrodipicolinate synthase